MVSKTRWLDRHLKELDDQKWHPIGIVNNALYLANVDKKRKITIGTAVCFMVWMVCGCITWMIDRVADIVVMEERKEAEEEAEK